MKNLLILRWLIVISSLASSAAWADWYAWGYDGQRTTPRAAPQNQSAPPTMVYAPQSMIVANPQQPIIVQNGVALQPVVINPTIVTQKGRNWPYASVEPNPDAQVVYVPVQNQPVVVVNSAVPAQGVTQSCPNFVQGGYRGSRWGVSYGQCW